jgi:hypothetical protein
MRIRGAVAGGVVAAAAFASLAVAAPVNVPNGNFEEGNLSKWQRFEPGGGQWGVYEEMVEPPAPRGFLGGFPPPPQGTYAAGATQNGPGLNILHRVLKLKDGKVNKIKFELFYRNTVNRFYAPNHFRFGGGGGMVPLPRGEVDGPPNQQLRIDLMKRGAKLKSLKDDDILATLLHTEPGDPKTRQYKPLKANMTKLGIDANRVRLRIAEVDNRGEFLVGVDNLKQSAR